MFERIDNFEMNKFCKRPLRYFIRHPRRRRQITDHRSRSFASGTPLLDELDLSSRRGLEKREREAAKIELRAGKWRAEDEAQAEAEATPDMRSPIVDRREERAKYQ